MERWQPQALARQVTLVLQPLPALPELTPDTMRISQVLGILLHNALKHTEAGGRVTVMAATERKRVGISVTDDGVGIDSDDLPGIFDRFYRTGQARGNGMYGTGLGLAIARDIVEKHDGAIVATSEGAGLGATMRIDLPLP